MKHSLKLYLSTLLLALSLASFAFAGDDHCPLTDPPPPTDGGTGRMAVPVDADSANPSVKDDYQLLKGIWEFLTQNTDLF